MRSTYFAVFCKFAMYDGDADAMGLSVNGLNSESLRLYYFTIEKGSKVEADVVMCPLLSLLRREENRDGDTYVPYALNNY